MKKDDNEKYVETLETEQLIEIILKLENYEETSAALVELSSRNPNKMIEISTDILVRELGDQYFQGLTFSILYGKNEKTAIEIISKRIINLDVVILKDLMDELITDCYQPIAKEISSQLLSDIQVRYQSLNKQEKDRVIEQYNDFMKFYGHRIVK